MEGQEKLGHFFGTTLFSEPVVANQEQLQDALLGKLGELRDSLAPEANTNPPSIQAQERARLLGSLIGTVEGGFQFAVDELEQKNEATAGFVDFLFNAGSLIPALPFPGGGLVKDLTVDPLQEWVTDSLTEDAKQAEDSLPFHAAFSQGIDNPALRTAYDAARGDVFQNVVKELIDQEFLSGAAAGVTRTRCGVRAWQALAPVAARCHGASMGSLPLERTGSAHKGHLVTAPGLNTVP